MAKTLGKPLVLEKIPAKTLPLASLSKGKVKASVDREMALRFLGYKGQTVDGALLHRFEELACRCEQANQGSYVWLVDEIDEEATRWVGEDPQVALSATGLTLPGRDIGKHLARAKQVVLLACTLGQGCERELRQLNALSTLDFVLYDACASALTEAVGNAVHDRLCAVAQDAGLYAHARFSPGYGDLPLSVQPTFLAAVQADRMLGLTANNTHLLVPTKSITAIVGLFDDCEQDDGGSPCDICSARAYCSFRERGLTCHGKRL